MAALVFFNLIVFLRQFCSGLPDLPWYNIPKWGKIIPNYHKPYQMVIKYIKWL
jgi:hypothetical protein